MLIKVENKGVTNNGYANMSVIVKKSEDNIPTEAYFISVLNALRDINERAFLNALDAFLKQELEQDDDEE